MRLAEEFKKLADEAEAKKKTDWTEEIMKAVTLFRPLAEQGLYSAKFYLREEVPKNFALQFLREQGFSPEIGENQEIEKKVVYPVEISWSQIYYSGCGGQTFSSRL